MRPVAAHLRGISKSFGFTAALVGVDLTIRAGEVLALLGENGAGKSTLVKVLTGVIAPDAGTIEIGGARARQPDPAARRGTGHRPGRPGAVAVPRDERGGQCPHRAGAAPLRDRRSSRVAPPHVRAARTPRHRHSIPGWRFAASRSPSASSSRSPRRWPARRASSCSTSRRPGCASTRWSACSP